MITDEVHEPGNSSIDTDWRIGDEINLCQDGGQESHGATVGCAGERSIWYPNALRWCCCLLSHPISHLATSFYFKKLKRYWKDTFCVNRRNPEVCNVGLKRHPTKCVPGMLQTMAAPLKKVCADTRDVLWRWLHYSWWINKIKLFNCQTSYL
jgi:hypothetical protein